MLKPILKAVLALFLFVLLTALTQVGGIVLLLSTFIANRIKRAFRFKQVLVFFLLYGLSTYLVVPKLAPFFGRETVRHYNGIQPANCLTIALNRNYVRPALNEVLRNTASSLEETGIVINYLDANFPFFQGFPLLPHLSHNDGKKIDLSLVYETAEGVVSSEQKSFSGYGVFVGPKPGERDQIRSCLSARNGQYDFTKYAKISSINRHLLFSEKGTRQLVAAILRNDAIGKIFIEPHLKQRLGLTSKRVRYHGCQAVRHDDHIHLQLH